MYCIWILLLILLALILLALLFTKNSGRRKLLSVLGAAAAIAAVVMTALQTVFYFGSDRAAIKNRHEQDVVLECRNHPVSYEYFWLRFSAPDDPDSLLRLTAEQYPGAWYDELTDRILFWHGGELFSLRCDENTRFLWSKRYVYQFGSESCRTKSGEGDKTVSIPFPAGLSADSDYEDVTRSRKIRCDFRTLADYYKDCESAEITDSAVTLHCGGFDAVLTVNAEHILTVDVRMTE